MNQEKEIKYYAGIGSRETPDDILEIMTEIAIAAEKKDYILRSGGAAGADSAFEKGAGDKKIIYIPWEGFNDSKEKAISITTEALKMASEFHPAWHYLSYGARKLQARNCYQILGEDLKTPVNFVICWTSNGKDKGGTGQAIRLAKANDITVFNLAIEEHLNFWKEKIC
jgi:hypothetical protein